VHVPCVWIGNVYNTGPNWYLSEVWLEQAMRRRRGAYLSIPVCEPNAWNGDFFQIVPRADEVVVTKHRYGAFESGDLDLVLRSRGIRTVVMTGVATNVCVETTARQAFLRDYYVVLTSDCTATYSRVRGRRDAAEQRRVFRCGGQRRGDMRLLAHSDCAAARGYLIPPLYSD
jgi:nicotinamidase-related amidase